MFYCYDILQNNEDGKKSVRPEYSSISSSTITGCLSKFITSFFFLWYLVSTNSHTENVINTCETWRACVPSWMIWNKRFVSLCGCVCLYQHPPQPFCEKGTKGACQIWLKGGKITGVHYNSFVDYDHLVDNVDAKMTCGSNSTNCVTLHHDPVYWKHRCWKQCWWKCNP